MIKLHLIDEINVFFEGLTKQDIAVIREKTKKSVDGAFQTAAFKLGKWDGKESQFSEEGYCFSFMLDDILDILEKNRLYDLDKDIELMDHRMDDPVPAIEPIDKYYAPEHLVPSLHDHQVDSINRVIEERKGIIKVATSGGKTVVCSMISKLFDPYLPSLVVVPDTTLLNQTYKTYETEGSLNVTRIRKEDSKKVRKEKIANYRHIIITFGLLNNLLEEFEGFQGVLLWDETHILGEKMMEALRITLSECPVRVGMTASIPKSGWKKEKIMCHIGGDVLVNTETKELQDLGIVSSCNIHVIPTHDPNPPSIDSWDDEKAYLNKNEKRAKAVAEYLDSLPPTNTLILTHPQFGKRLSKHIDVIGFVDKDTDTEIREEYYAEFADNDGCRLIATFGTAGTGISIDRIFRLVTIDIGKNPTAIVQSIGRGLRLDGEINHVDIMDIYADLPYSNKHKRSRLNIYKKSKHPYKEHVAIPVLH